MWQKDRDTEWTHKFEERQFFLQDMEFKVNQMKADMDLLNRTFS